MYFLSPSGGHEKKTLPFSSTSNLEVILSKECPRRDIELSSCTVYIEEENAGKKLTNLSVTVASIPRRYIVVKTGPTNTPIKVVGRTPPHLSPSVTPNNSSSPRPISISPTVSTIIENEVDNTERGDAQLVETALSTSPQATPPLSPGTERAAFIPGYTKADSVPSLHHKVTKINSDRSRRHKDGVMLSREKSYTSRREGSVSSDADVEETTKATKKKRRSSTSHIIREDWL